MKLVGIVLFALAVFSLDVFLAVRYCNPLGSRLIACTGNPHVFNACDFRMRWNEVELVKRGVDPIDVCRLNVDLPPYVPAERYDLRSSEKFEPVNCYVPWEYTFFGLLTLLPRGVAWRIYYGLMVLAAVLIGVYSFRRGKELRNELSDGLFCSASALFVSMALWLDFQSGNYPLILSAVLLGMIIALNRRKDVLAGACWALLMMKPHVGLLFAIPLLVKRRWKAIVSAVVICGLASIPPALMVRRSLLEMILEVPGASVYAFQGCGFVPSFLVRLVAGDEAFVNLLLLAGLAIGGTVCFAFTFVLRKHEDWVVLIAPAALCSVLWTYYQDYSFSITWPMLLMLALEALKIGGLGRMWPFLLAIALVARVHMAIAKAIEIAGIRFFGWNDPSVYSLTGDVVPIIMTVLIAVLCAHIARRYGQ